MLFRNTIGVTKCGMHSAKCTIGRSHCTRIVKGMLARPDDEGPSLDATC